nr:GntR family transcriptional regulator [Microbacterium sp. CBA3102]
MTESGAASHASASEVAYHHLRAQILDGALLGGSMISEGMVANELGMSRTPVREAFLRLQGEGWLRLYPKRGAFVVEVRPHEREEIVRARVLLESDAVSRVSGDAGCVPNLSSDCRRSSGGSVMPLRGKTFTASRSWTRTFTLRSSMPAETVCYRTFSRR